VIGLPAAGERHTFSPAGCSSEVALDILARRVRLDLKSQLNPRFA
jgi:hypothetical protein